MESSNRYEDHRYDYYPLVLPQVALGSSTHEEVVTDSTSGQLLLVDWHQRRIVETCAFRSLEELNVVQALFHAWPSYVEDEKLLQLILHQSRQQVIHSLESDARGEALEALQQVLDACRQQLLSFCIDIEVISGVGYKLSRFVGRKEGARA